MFLQSFYALLASWTGAAVTVWHLLCTQQSSKASMMLDAQVHICLKICVLLT